VQKEGRRGGREEKEITRLVHRGVNVCGKPKSEQKHGRNEPHHFDEIGLSHLVYSQIGVVLCVLLSKAGDRSAWNELHMDLVCRYEHRGLIHRLSSTCLWGGRKLHTAIDVGPPTLCSWVGRLQRELRQVR
jgi:hypothetical protein